MGREALRTFRRRKINPGRQEVVKFVPSSPPRRGETILVDGVRSRVTRCKVKWDGPRWMILSLRVKDAT